VSADSPANSFAVADEQNDTVNTAARKPGNRILEFNTLADRGRAAGEFD
jgi:hypothetical protein